ncbi:MAG: CotH kinase family protein [Caldilineaceae bacterium]|nr:CotH kinase family protein [Caldilineaceae bacterium]
MRPIHLLNFRLRLLSLALVLAFGLSACTPMGLPASFSAAEDLLISVLDEDGESEVSNAASPVTADSSRPVGWNDASHSNKTDPNYAVVFPTDRVNQITFRIEPEEWAAMQTNMTELFGEQGTGGGPGGMGLFAPPTGMQPPPGGVPFGNRAEGMAPRSMDLTPENPMWVEATVEFEGEIWTHVGIRYKGNSSLRSGWGSGALKLPFKLDFDEFEDDYPEIKNQRFYGFKQLSFANHFSDASGLRETVTYALLEEAGLPAAKTAFYEIILDYGEGPISLGLYTLVEMIDDTVVPRIFGSDDGNIYEGDGAAASLAANTFDQIAESFTKENNKNSDWSDIEELFTRLHSDLRTSDPDQWRADLEAIFDMDSFLRWLALSAVIQHWDTYGAMTHNYYLYNDPVSGRLTWISWDHNMSMMAGMGGGRGGFGGRSTSLDKKDVNANWPLIRYVLDEPAYYALYVRYVEEAAALFAPDKMAETYTSLAEMVAPFISAEIGEAAFESAVQQLIDHAYTRAEAVQIFLDNP